MDRWESRSGDVATHSANLREQYRRKAEELRRKPAEETPAVSEGPSCGECGGSLVGMNPTAKYCGTPCRKKAWKRQRQFAGWRVMDVQEAAISRYVKEREEDGAARSTVGYEIAILRRGFNLAHRERLVDRVPAFPSLGAANVRTGLVDDGQFDRILAELPERVRPLAEFAFLTGWRLNEVLGLTWPQVDFEAGTLRLEPGTTKNRQGRTFPLIPRLRALLEAQRERKRAIERRTGRVIRACWFSFDGPRAGDRIRDFRGAWEGACKRAGSEGLLFHDLRRTAVRNLVRAGVPEQVAMKRTGHKTRSVFDRYAIVDEQMLREGAAKLTEFLDGRKDEEQDVIPLDGKRKAAEGGGA